MDKQLNQMPSHFFQSIARHGRCPCGETKLANERLLEFIIVRTHHVSGEKLMSHDDTFKSNKREISLQLAAAVPLFLA